MHMTLWLIALTCAVSWFAFKRADWWYRLVLLPPRVIAQREYWRLLTSGLIHADMQHLLFNMITLYFFGTAIEGFFAQQLGAAGYVAFYVSALVVSGWPSCWRHRHDKRYATLGASGAVMAVLFSFIMLDPWALIFVFIIPVPAIVFALVYIVSSIYLDRRQGDQINHNAHLWGALYGIMFVLVMEPRVLPFFWQQLLAPFH